MIALVMQPPPKSGPGNSSGPSWAPARPVRDQLGQQFADKPAAERRFRLPTGEQATLEAHPRQVGDGTEPLVASRRGERGAQIAADIRRVIFFACILFGVAIVLALFVSELL
jgi:hypothetical protein